MFSKTKTKRVSTVATPTPKTSTEIVIEECIKVFKRKNIESVKQYLSLVPNPTAIKVTYQPEWDEYFVNPRHVTLLHLAAEHGWINICRELIKLYKFHPDVTDDQQVYTPLHYAIGGKRFSTVRVLLEEFNCDPHCSKSPVSPLVLASKMGNVEIIDYLLNEWECDPNGVDHLYNTPLHYAASKGRLEAVLNLMSTGKITRPACNVYGDTPLHLAARHGFEEIFVSLLSHMETRLSSCVNCVGKIKRFSLLIKMYYTCRRHAPP